MAIKLQSLFLTFQVLEGKSSALLFSTHLDKDSAEAFAAQHKGQPAHAGGAQARYFVVKLDGTEVDPAEEAPITQKLAQGEEPKAAKPPEEAPHPAGLPDTADHGRDKHKRHAHK